MQFSIFCQLSAFLKSSCPDPPSSYPVLPVKEVISQTGALRSPHDSSCRQPGPSTHRRSSNESLGRYKRCVYDPSMRSIGPQCKSWEIRASRRINPCRLVRQLTVYQSEKQPKESSFRSLTRSDENRTNLFWPVGSPFIGVKAMRGARRWIAGKP